MVFFWRVGRGQGPLGPLALSLSRALVDILNIWDFTYRQISCQSLASWVLNGGDEKNSGFGGDERIDLNRGFKMEGLCMWFCGCYRREIVLIFEVGEL